MCEARLKVLEELVFRREGFYPGVKAILEESSQNALAVSSESWQNSSKSIRILL